MDEKELWDKYGNVQKDRPVTFGPHFSYQFRHSPRHILFSFSRYKFAQKMIGPGKRIIELGCSDGIGTVILAEGAQQVLGVDFDRESIDCAKRTLSDVANMSFQCDNFLDKSYGNFDAVVSYDVIEHIYPKNEELYVQTVLQNMNETGIFLVCTPNIEAVRFSRPEIQNAHVNVFSGERLLTLLNKFFDHVFLFSQNDEMVHTGYTPMAHNLLCLCCGKKSSRGSGPSLSKKG